LPGDQTWKIHEDYANLAFFGGEAELRCQVDTRPTKSLKFKIRGKNPDAATAKSYLQGLTGAPWYLYAIAKSESQPGGAIYSQFWAKTVTRNVAEKGQPLNTRIFRPGEPLWGRDDHGLGGWGLLQLTPKVPVPRARIWNWQENAKAGLVLLQTKISGANGWMTSQRAKAKTPSNVAIPVRAVSYPNEAGGDVMFVDETARTIEDAVAIKLYNGASKPQGMTNFPGTGQFCYYGRAPLATSSNRWRFVPTNNLGFNYVQRVCSKVED
jgi:hypothetical protein